MIDHYTAIVPVHLEKDPWPIVRPFEWRVWLGIFVCPPIFLLSTVIADFYYNDGTVEIDRLCSFTLRIVLVEVAQYVPDTKGREDETNLSTCRGIE
jgi:hypothetical protein